MLLLQYAYFASEYLSDLFKKLSAAGMNVRKCISFKAGQIHRQCLLRLGERVESIIATQNEFDVFSMVLTLGFTETGLMGMSWGLQRNRFDTSGVPVSLCADLPEPNAQTTSLTSSGAAGIAAPGEAMVNGNDHIEVGVTF